MIYNLIIGVSVLCLVTYGIALLIFKREEIYRFIRRLIWGWYDKHAEWHRLHNDRIRILVSDMQALGLQHDKQVREFIILQMEINKGLLKKGLLTNEQYNTIKKRADGI